VSQPVGSVWLLGCGNMGGALRARWEAAGIAVTVIDPAFGNVAVPSGQPDILVLGVKPQIWRDAAASVASPKLVMSVMAGVTCAALAARFPDTPVIRTMPNTPARLGLGITALYGHAATPGDRATAEAMMRAAGTCVWLDREGDFDAVTALSGSGPAYLFAFIEALAAAGVAAGLTPRLSDELARHTVIGATALAAESGAVPADLRAAVTSHGGTTAAGLAVLQAGLPKLLCATVAAAQTRSRQLG